MNRCVCLAAALLLAGMLMGCGRELPAQAPVQAKIPVGDYPVFVEPSGNEKVDALVCQLVSKRPAPYRSGYADPPSSMLDDYTTPEVELAIKELRAMGPAVFPALMKHRYDDRYSYSIVVAAWNNCSVDDAIVKVLCDGHSMHSGYKSRHTPSGGASYLSFKDYLEKKDQAEWAERAKSQTRLQIQQEFIDWCVAQENARGYTDEAQKTYVLVAYDRARKKMQAQYGN